jgi:hypothetical protein
MNTSQIRSKLQSAAHVVIASALPLTTYATNWHRIAPKFAPPQEPNPATNGLPPSPFMLAPAPDASEGVLSHILGSINPFERVLCFLAGAALGALIGAFFSDRFRRWRKLIALVLFTIIGAFVSLVHNGLAFGVGFISTAVIVYRLLKDNSLQNIDNAIFGDAHPATYDELSAAGHVPAFDPATSQYKPAEPGIPLGFTL